MSSVPVTITAGPPSPADPAALLLEAAGAAKCAPCGCAHEASAALAGLPGAAPPRLRDAAQRLAASLTGQRYACLGCAVCWPAEALSALQPAGLVSRLDHAAYLGRELARAEHALRTGTPYRQDAAPG